jgi:SAM-dependent methyltransferase
MPHAWSVYPECAGHYSPADIEQKHEWLRQILVELRPARVLDIGANHGDYSLIAASSGAAVVALERDPLTAERLYQRTRRLNLPIQVLRADIAQPTPATGWENAETVSLLDRLEHRFDLVLLLAVVHHLLLIEQVPLPRILQLCHRLTQSHLVLEWVPASDPMYQILMRGRNGLYGLLSEHDLLSACQGIFQPLRRHELSNGRVLFLLKRI